MSDLKWAPSTRKPGAISRRDLLRQTAAVGALGGIYGVAPRSAAAATPKRGGHLRIGVEGGSTNLTLDPAIIATQYTQTVGYLWGNSLIEVDENGRMTPELAEAWDSNNDATQWTFRLRKGVQFHNGKEMTAADVGYSLNYHRDPASKSLARSVVRGIKEIKVSNKYEMTITLESGNVDAPGLLSDYHLLIMPENGKPADGMGTGPYIIDKFDSAVHALAHRNSNYWKTDRAHADSVEVLTINDSTARNSALLSGQVQFISRVDPKLFKSMSENPNVSTVEVTSGQHYCFPMRRDINPFDNNDLCLAMKFAIDREDMVKRILLDHGNVGNDQPVPTFDLLYAKDIPQRQYDPDKARFHFKKSGVSGPLPLYVADAAFPNAISAATVYKEHAKKAGIDIDVQRVPDDGYWDSIWEKKPFCAAYWGGRVSAGLFLQAVYVSSSTNNESFWKRPEFDELLARAQSELNADKRKQMYHDLQMMIWDDGGEIIPMFANRLFAMSKAVDGFVRSPVFTGFRVAEQLYLVS
jgi:peptide/nickel transport system substrate-binding protein